MPTDCVAGGESFTLSFTSGPASADLASPELQDLGDGTYTTQFTLEIAGDYQISVALDDAPISGGVYTRTVIAARPDAGGITLSSHTESLVAGYVGSVLLTLRDSYGNLPAFDPLAEQEQFSAVATAAGAVEITSMWCPASVAVEPDQICTVNNQDGTFSIMYAFAKYFLKKLFS